MKHLEHWTILSVIMFSMLFSGPMTGAWAEEATSNASGLSAQETETWDEYEEMVLTSENEDAHAAQREYTPAYGSGYPDPALNYWTLPMDITDEAAVWDVLMQPITVLNGKSFERPERTQITVRSEPSLDSPGIGVVTCENLSFPRGASLF